MFVWEGKVVHVPPDLSVSDGKFLPSHFVARVNDPRPGLLVIGMNFQDPSILSTRDGLRMNLLQQLAPFMHVWGISLEELIPSATWEKVDVRVHRGWKSVADRVARTIIGMVCPNWIPGTYLDTGLIGLGYGNQLFEITFTHFFPVGVRKVFIMPNDVRRLVEGMARTFREKNPQSHIKSVLLTPTQARLIHPLFRATHAGQERPEYESTLSAANRGTPRAEHFDKLDPQHPYLLLYAGFEDALPSEMSAVVEFLRWHTIRNGYYADSRADVAHVAGEVEADEGDEGDVEGDEGDEGDEDDVSFPQQSRAPPTTEEIAAHQRSLNERFPVPSVPKVPAACAPPLPDPKPMPRLSRESDMEISQLRAQIQIHGKQKRTIWQVYGCHPVNQWYNTSKEAVSEVEYMGGYAVDHVLRTGETIECAPGARTEKSLGFCVRECFHLLGHTEVQLPNHVPLKQCLQALSNDPAFTLLKPSGWPMHDVPLRQPISIASFLAKYKAGHYVLQVHVSDVGTNLHCIAVRGQQVADPEDGIWRPLTAESFASLSIDEVNFGLAVQGRAGGGDGGVVMQQAAGGTEVDGQGRPVKTNESCSLACLTSTPGRGESLASTPDVRGVRDNSAFSRSPAEPSGQHGRMESASAIPSSTAQQCFQLLGETAALLPPHATLKVCLQVFSKSTFLLRKPNSWDISLPLVNPVSVPVFLQAYKPGRYVLQVSVSPAGKGMHFVAIDGQRMADPADCIWLRLTEESFTLLSITRVISGLQLVPR